MTEQVPCVVEVVGGLVIGVHICRDEKQHHKVFKQICRETVLDNNEPRVRANIENFHLLKYLLRKHVHIQH